MANEYNISSIAVEVVRDGASGIVFSQIAVEVVRDCPSAQIRVAQIGIEVVRSLEVLVGRRRQLVMGSS